MFVGRTDWGIERGKAEPACVVAQCREHRQRYAVALQARRHHDFERTDAGGLDALQPIAMGPADYLVPTAIGQRLASAPKVWKAERRAEGPRHRPVRFGGIDCDQPVIAIVIEISVA